MAFFSSSSKSKNVKRQLKRNIEFTCFWQDCNWVEAVQALPIRHPVGAGAVGVGGVGGEGVGEVTQLESARAPGVRRET